MGNMDKYLCVCGWVYDPEVGDPEGGIAPATPFVYTPDAGVCRVCVRGMAAFPPWGGRGGGPGRAAPALPLG